MSRIPIEEQIKAVAYIKGRINTNFNGKVLYVMISGADLYGFPSIDSDVDYRGAFLGGTEHFLGLFRKRDNIVELEPYDIAFNELAKEVNLAIKSNCNVLEHINAEPIYRTAEWVELRQLVNNTFGKKGLYNSYKGMSVYNYKKFILRGKKSYKKYLYVFRGILAGIYCLQTGRIEPNIVTLNKYFKIPEVRELIQHKIEGTEQEEVQDLVDSGILDELIPPLYERLDKAYERSKIPDVPDPEDIERLNNWLISLRVAKLGK